MCVCFFFRGWYLCQTSKSLDRLEAGTSTVPEGTPAGFVCGTSICKAGEQDVVRVHPVIQLVCVCVFFVADICVKPANQSINQTVKIRESIVEYVYGPL